MVNTFITSPSLEKCAKNLDNLRLGKQRVECIQLISFIENTNNKGFKNHPVLIMWKEHVTALKVYCNFMIREFIARGFENTIPIYELDETKIVFYDNIFNEETGLTEIIKPQIEKDSIVFPIWFNWNPLILTHQASLLKKNNNYYSKIFEHNPKFFKLGYLWMNKIPENYYEIPFNFNWISPLGTGVPSHYRLSIEDCKEWLKDKNINPKTGHKIKTNIKIGIYADYYKASIFYNILEIK